MQRTVQSWELLRAHRGCTGIIVLRSLADAACAVEAYSTSSGASNLDDAWYCESVPARIQRGQPKPDLAQPLA